MKLLFEVSSRTQDSTDLTFTWLSDQTGVIFALEGGKCLRLLRVERDNYRQLKEISLTEHKVCTDFSWNKDDRLLALVLDHRQVYIWNLISNSFTHFKPSLTKQSASHLDVGRKFKCTDIDRLVWSQVSDKLAICYDTGFIHLCDFSTPTTREKALDHGSGVLKRILKIVTSRGIDLFACCTVISEILVASFDGELKIYIASCNTSIIELKLAPEIIYIDWHKKRKGVWLGYQFETGSFQFKLVELTDRDEGVVSEPGEPLTHSWSNSNDEPSVDHFDWLDGRKIITCSASGTIRMTSFEDIEHIQPQVLVSLELKAKVISFELGQVDRNGCKSVATATSQEIFYHELTTSSSTGRSADSRLALIDSLNLAENLQRIQTTIKCVKWSSEGAMLAAQLNSGTALVYRARLDSQLVARHQSKVAYLAGPEEIMVLDFGSPSTGELEFARKAHTVDVGFKPSLIAIGELYVAVALNNRVRFYSTRESTSLDLVDEQEYSSIVTSMALNDHFVAVSLTDARLKLHAIKSGRDDGEYLDQERYFPDPLNPEEISAFTLCKQLLIYASSEFSISIFCLTAWTTIQRFNYSSFGRPIIEIKANQVGNKMVCILAGSNNNVFLYDLYTNSSCLFGRAADRLYSQMSSSQLGIWQDGKRLSLGGESSGPDGAHAGDLGKVLDAIWDADGRAVNVFGRDHFCTFVVLDHTLAREGPTIEFVADSSKAISHAPLYASQGIIAFQTRTGRVVNQTVGVYDNEANLKRLNELARASKGDGQGPVMWARVEYLLSALKIYSLARAGEICESLASSAERTQVEFLWRQLAIRSIFLMNLEFAWLISVRCELRVFVLVLDCIRSDARRLRIDSRLAVRRRLLTMLNCKPAD